MGETILVVDDEEQIRGTLRGVLADEGFTVLEAENGRTALDLLARESPRVITSYSIHYTKLYERADRRRATKPRVRPARSSTRARRGRSRRARGVRGGVPRVRPRRAPERRRGDRQARITA